MLCEADMFSLVVAITNDGTHRANNPVIKALVSYLKNHRVNEQNVFESLKVLFPTAKLIVLKESNKLSELKGWAFDMLDPTEDEYEAAFVKSGVGYRVEFEDESKGYAFSVNGIGVYYTGQTT